MNGKTILLVSHALPKISTDVKLKADIVIITNNPKLYINDLYSRINCKTIIADNNTSQWKVAKWKQDCDSLHIHFHSISQQGAFAADL